MPAKKPVPPTAIYQLKITLQGLRPPIWRRVLVADDTSLAKLNFIIQIAMGWTNSHLHDFTILGERYSEPSPEDWEPVKDERRYKLNQLVTGAKFKFTYQYDFGDSWDHAVVVEKILPPDPGVRSPVCVAGKRACPPEDVGGVWGYTGFLEALADPNHAEHESYLEWIGGEFDPEAFDLDAVNKELRRLR
jgi:hypothetical protein